MSPKTEEDAAMDVSRRSGVPYASLENRLLRMERGQGLERMIPKDVAQREIVLPLFLDRDVLAVAVLDPKDESLIERLWKASGRLIQPFVSTRAQILNAIETDYR